ncbi:9797_t:CDS:2, partial [Dentiscutata heterogama]
TLFLSSSTPIIRINLKGDLEELRPLSQSLLPSNLKHQNDLMQDTLKILRFLRHNKLEIHCSQNRS